MKQVTPLTQLKFSIISCSYMYQSDEDIIRLTLEHLKGYKNCKMLETGFHVYKLSFVFPKQFKMKIKKKTRRKQYVSMVSWAPRVLCFSAVCTRQTMCSAQFSHGVR